VHVQHSVIEVRRESSGENPFATYSEMHVGSANTHQLICKQSGLNLFAIGATIEHCPNAKAQGSSDQRRKDHDSNGIGVPTAREQEAYIRQAQGPENDAKVHRFSPFAVNTDTNRLTTDKKVLHKGTNATVIPQMIFPVESFSSS
jgi:hypothetical protein